MSLHSPDKFAQAAAAQEEYERRGESQPYLFAEQANAELDALRREYVDLMLRFDAALAQQDDLARAYDALLAKQRATAAALSRALDVLANLQTALEKKHAPIPQQVMAPVVPLHAV